MLRSLFLLVSCCFASIGVWASAVDSLESHYSDRSFTTYVQVQVDVPESIINKVVDDFIYQTKYELDSLFQWALKGLMLRKEKNNLLVFNFKSTTYDPKSELIKAVGDVEVPGIITFPDIHVDSKMTKTSPKDGSSKVDINILYSDAFLKETTAVFRIVPHKTKGYSMTLETKIRFGWFFNIFITTPSYRRIMEWRFERLMLNIQQEAERRHKLAYT